QDDESPEQQAQRGVAVGGDDDDRRGGQHLRRQDRPENRADDGDIGRPTLREVPRRPTDLLAEPAPGRATRQPTQDSDNRRSTKRRNDDATDCAHARDRNPVARQTAIRSSPSLALRRQLARGEHLYDLEFARRGGSTKSA